MRIIIVIFALIVLASPSWGEGGDTIVSVKSLTEWFIDFIQGVYEFEVNLNVIGNIVYIIAVFFLGAAFLFVKFVVPQLFLWIPLFSPLFYYGDKLQEKLDTSISKGSWIKTFFLKKDC